MGKRLAATAAILTFVFPWKILAAETFVPVADEFASALVMTPKTHEVLYAFKPHQPRVAASLTKLANALAFVSVKPRLDKVFAMKKTDEVGGGRLRVNPGAQLTVQDALYCSVTASANNVATALARVSGLGGKGFVARMNDRAKRVGATHSVFFDASGMDPRNRTTAMDIALIAEAAFRHPVIRQAASAPTYRFTIRNTGTKKTVTNTNHLLTRDPDVWVVGGKTGYLEESQYNLAVQLRPLDENGKPVYGKDLLVVVMGAPTKEGSFWSAKRLAQWAWFHHEF